MPLRADRGTDPSVPHFDLSGRTVEGKWVPLVRITRISHRLTVEARDRPAITSLRLLAVLTVLPEYASLIKWESSSGARLLLTGLSRTSPRHAMRKAG